ncbi:exo-alpha-sialidase [Candidatus Bathyarchaeota archaeon]|jgi:hypothetical protein|nr:exo-alpha-sialidase [Candidatus Bathyarchaeota archaeon]MBT4319713.1 exo-alpha-sialidase [Candidatus Bathyarchaeota archaeon]MBT4424604.1 exo-alpha-sialidase [Candidatus Bathyarchaeota archaeon]MBT6604411.1 exo-alpha-sialidase [Candidatus Bathyarchaeota archaeon]MBT7187415.1 exo-alpha-sialidase [Candidatus Bathyarchaeota archaeon]
MSHEKLTRFGYALVNQEKARVIIEPNQRASGYWFGGGNMSQHEDLLYLVGRYRNAGDSRKGLGLGERGLELAVFRSEDAGYTFDKVISLSKNDLAGMDEEGRAVKSIEGSTLSFTPDGVELYVSSEKALSYPDDIVEYQKPDTGIWTIEYCKARDVESISECTLKTVLRSSDPRWLHLKDPTIHKLANGGTVLGFVTHPFSWSSSNTAYCSINERRELNEPVFNFLQRGFTWDVAVSRATAWLNVPRVGKFADGPKTLIFYDGAESMRDLDEHKEALKRPRGYSCEELGGLAVSDASGVGDIQRLSVKEPLFTSPMGTGCSRYVDILETREGFYATWQQSQDDQSQPLVMNFLSREDAEKILS